MNSKKGFFIFLRVISSLFAIGLALIAAMLTNDAKEFEYDFDEINTTPQNNTTLLYEVIPKLTYDGQFFSIENTEIVVEIRRDSIEGEILAKDNLDIELETNSNWRESIFLRVNSSIFYDSSIDKYLVVSVDGDYNLRSQKFIGFDFTYSKKM